MRCKMRCKMSYSYLLLILAYLSVVAGKIRNYYLAAVDYDWDYAPNGFNMVSNDTSFSDIFTKNAKNRIGSYYTKVMYREFSDANFTNRVPTPKWMGILGPLMRAEVGDEMHVHFKNMAYTSGRPFSVHPHGVLYTKDNEGALYLDRTSGKDKKDDGLYPGEEYTYIWKVTPEFGPTPDDPPCIPWGYHSHVYADKDIDTGLVGLLLTCKKGALLTDGTRKDFPKEYIIYMDRADENNSWMFKSNLHKCADPDQCINHPDPGFAASNVMWHVNGFVYGNLPGIEMHVGERIMWYIMSLNSGIQSISFSGNTLIHRNHRVDTIPFLPSTFLSAEMTPSYEGYWLLYSRVSENWEGGMSAFYKVNPAPAPKKQKRQAAGPDNRSYLNRGRRLSTGNIWNFLSSWNSRMDTWNIPNNFYSRMYPTYFSPWYTRNYPTSWTYPYNGYHQIPYRVSYWTRRQNPWGFMYPGSSWNPWSFRNYPIQTPVLTTQTPLSESPDAKTPIQANTTVKQDVTQGPLPAIGDDTQDTVSSEVNTEDVKPSDKSTQLPIEKDPTPHITTTIASISSTDAAWARNAWERPGIFLTTRNPTALETETTLHPAGISPATPPPPPPPQTKPVPYNPWYPFPFNSKNASPLRRISRTAKRSFNLLHKLRMSNTKRYYLAIEKEKWNYAPSGQDQFNGGPLLSNKKAKPYFEGGPMRIGAEYIKARFVEYTDGTFTQRVTRPIEEHHLGLLGPPIVAEVGDNLIVVLRNNADRPYSFSPHGVIYDKNQEGFLYKDKQNNHMRGRIAQPGQTISYSFSIPHATAGPTPNDAPCITHTYQSSVHPVKDVNTGLFGPVVICKSGQLHETFNWYSRVNRHSWFFTSKHVYLALLTVDENESWYIDENIQTYTTSPGMIDKADPDFKESNAMHSINGRVFGNLEGIEMCISDTVAWHLMDFGGTTDMHGLYIHGQTWLEFGNNIDSKGLLPGYASTLTSKPDTIGTWALVCRTNSHFEIGMVAQYTVNQCGQPTNVFEESKTRKYFIGAVELEWDYAPLKRSLVDGEELVDMNQPGGVFVVDNDMLIGSIYKKAVYRLFTDETFLTEVPRGPEDEHLGLMGPFIKAEIGESVEVVFKNMASKSLSIHPQGLQYNKNMEGALYNDKTESVVNGNSVAPGKTFTYMWNVPGRAGPGKNDPNCIGRMYYSSVDSVTEMYSGLFGPLVVCRAGILDVNGHRNDMDKEFAVMFMVIDENKSFYLKENILNHAPMKLKMMKSVGQTLNPVGQKNNITVNNDITGRQVDNLQINNDNGRAIMPGGGEGQSNNIDPVSNHDSMHMGGVALGRKGDMSMDEGSMQSIVDHDYTRLSVNNNIQNSGLSNSKHRRKKRNINSSTVASDVTLSKHRNVSDLNKQPVRRPRKLRNFYFHASISKQNSTASRPIIYMRASGINRIRSNILNNTGNVTETFNIPDTPIHRHRRAGAAPMTHTHTHGMDEVMFEHSNHMNSINGRLMGNLNGIVMDQGDKVAWYIMGLGSAEDYHPVHIHGQVFTRRSDRSHGSDVVEVFPSTSDTVEMLAVNPGHWILHCHFSKHAKNGMQLIYTVNPKT